MSLNEMNNLFSDLCEEAIEAFEEDVLVFLRSRALSVAYQEGKTSRTRIEELFEPILNLCVEEVAEDAKRIASEEKMFAWEDD